MVDPKSTHSTGSIRAVDTGAIPDYPEHLLDERLESHFFVTFHYRRWLTSATRLLCDDDVKGHILDLFFIAQDQTPIGTLPTDDRLLAKLMNMDLAKWQQLATRTVPPLHNWTPCLCRGVIRLMHPVVLELAEDAVSKRRANALQRAKRAEAKAFSDLRHRMIAAGSTRMADNPAVVEQVHEWLKENCLGNRTPARVKEAMEAISTGTYGSR